MEATDKLRFDKTDFSVTKLIAAGATALTAILAIGTSLGAWISGEALEVELPASSAMQYDPTVPGVVLTTGSTMMARFENPDAGLLLASMAPSLVLVALMAVATWLLWRVLDSVQADQPFTASTVNRMRALSYVVSIGAIVHQAVVGLVSGHLTSRATGETVLFQVSFDVGFIAIVVGGAMLAALAEAFRRGIRLEADAEGLV